MPWATQPFPTSGNPSLERADMTVAARPTVTRSNPTTDYQYRKS